VRIAKALGKAFLEVAAALLVSGLLLFLVKSLTLCEETLVVPSQWAYSWENELIERSVERRKSPWVSVSIELRPGMQNRNGACLVFSDTLVCVVTGPRSEVNEAVEVLSTLVRQ
jgi:hypothetical protein